MTKSKRIAIPVLIRRQLASLNHRVSWLEAALKPKKQKLPLDRVWADYERRNAERKTRDEAMTEYREREHEARYRENPNLVKLARKSERKENAFLRARGLKPNPSQIPKAFRTKGR